MFYLLLKKACFFDLFGIGMFEGLLLFFYCLAFTWGVLFILVGIVSWGCGMLVLFYIC